MWKKYKIYQCKSQTDRQTTVSYIEIFRCCFLFGYYKNKPKQKQATFNGPAIPNAHNGTFYEILDN